MKTMSLRPRPGKQESRFWHLATWAVQHNYLTVRQCAIIARLEGSRKSSYWRRHLRDLKGFMTWKCQQRSDEEAEETESKDPGEGVSEANDRAPLTIDNPRQSQSRTG